jgi:hypothetical protein
MKFQLSLMMAMTIAALFCACSRGGEEKAAVQAVPSKEDVRPAEVARIQDAGAKAAAVPAVPVPESLRGVWGKTDQPCRGMRIEFAPAAGMAAILIVAPPVDDAEAAAFFAQKNGDDKEQGARLAACMPKIWKAGVVKYADLKPTVRGDEWVGANESRLFRVTTCSYERTRREDVALRLVSKDELVATMADARGTTKTETWKRVPIEKR